jgi:hypothetical protein
MNIESETITVTVPKQFADYARQVAYLLGNEEKNLGETIAHTCGWLLRRECEDPEALVMEVEDLHWESEVKCRTAADRITQKLKDKAIIEPYFCDRGWRIRVLLTHGAVA